MTQAKVQVGARISQEWRSELEAIAAATGRPLAQVVEEAIGQFLQHEPNPHALPRQVETLKARVGEMELKLQGLMLLIAKS